MEAFKAGETLLPLLRFSSAGLGRSTRASRAITSISQQHHCSTSTTSSSRSRPSICDANSPKSLVREQYRGVSTSENGRSDSSKSDITAIFDSTLRSNKQSQSASRVNSTARSPSNTARSGTISSQTGSVIDELLESISLGSGRGGTARRTSSRAEINQTLGGNFPDLIGKSSSSSPTSNLLPQKLEPPSVKLGPTIGRTVRVNPSRNIDAARAFRQLEIKCANNRVRRDFMQQRFHERPGLKRKRLKSERWRRRFKANFNATVALVQKMRKQGW